MQLTESRFSSWEIFEMCNYYAWRYDRCHLLIMFSYWHTNNPQMTMTGGKKIHIPSGNASKGHPCSFLERIQRTHKHGHSLNSTVCSSEISLLFVEGDISIVWPLACRSPSLPFHIYTLINLSQIKKPDIFLFKWISSFCGILKLIEGSVLCGIHQDNCHPMQHCSRLHVYLLQSP